MPSRYLPAFKVIDGGDGSGNLTSKVTDCRNIHNIIYQCVWAGAASPVGNYVLEGSNDYLPNEYDTVSGTAKNAGNWTAVLTTAYDGSVQPQALEANQFPFLYARLRWARTSGSGTLTVTVAGKSLA